MPIDIDTETVFVDELPGIWSPVQWELTQEERNEELTNQATASLLWAVDSPEAILRLLLNEHEIERTFDPPPGYDSELQGEWDDSLITFQFKRPIRLEKVEREKDYLHVEYNFGELGHWAFEIYPDEVNIFRL